MATKIHSTKQESSPHGGIRDVTVHGKGGEEGNDIEHKRSRKALIAVDAVAGVSGLIGMAIVAFGWGHQFPTRWLDGTPFRSYVIPGLILGLVVGGSALLAMGATIKSACRCARVGGRGGDHDGLDRGRVHPHSRGPLLRQPSDQLAAGAVFRHRPRDGRTGSARGPRRLARHGTAAPGPVT